MSNCQIFKLSKGQNVKISKFVGDIEKALHGQLAQGDPALPGPKELKLKEEELVSYQFICRAGQKVSPLASPGVVAMTVNVILNIKSYESDNVYNTFTFRG